jgi:hypothetical protein
MFGISKREIKVFDSSVMITCIQERSASIGILGIIFGEKK